MLSDASRRNLIGRCVRALIRRKTLLAEGVVPDGLFISEFAVALTSLKRPDVLLKVGRMGEGELLGGSGLADATPMPTSFCAPTERIIYCDDKADLESWLGASGIGSGFSGAADVWGEG
ncbi:hypothetical protein BBI10_14320 [Pseudomonas graminis]|uniref:Uncharacterized protein n=1 Tax=Pseudomonas graminis TaxID=158627 RepID=A0A1C2DXU4_9PSED|nr:hypothetical protein BBI10_14320 [Pseudomonas graminis]